jgi:iron complex outermembrane receptor protein
VSVDNVLDTTYRRHLNRVRQIMPEPGRNLRILHKAFF